MTYGMIIIQSITEVNLICKNVYWVEQITNEKNVKKKLCMFIHKALVIRSQHTYVKNVWLRIANKMLWLLY